MRCNVKRISISIAVLGLLLAGCGYHRARFDNPLLANAHTIAIPYFKNKTFEPEAERIFTYAFMNEFIQSRKLQIVERNEADVILYGTVRTLSEDAIAHNQDDRALEYIMEIVLDLHLEERTTGKVLWQRKGMRHEEDYRILDDVQTSEASKRSALQKIASDLAERVHDSIMLGF